MPHTTLTAAIVPLDIKALDSDANVRAAIARIEALPPEVDLVVLPEMFNTGFTPDIDQIRAIAEAPDGSAMARLREAAIRCRIAIWGSYLAKDSEGHFYNQGFMIDPDADRVDFYNKHHLFRYGGESDVLTAGSELAPIMQFRGWRLKMSLCYDIRFPVWNRSRANDYDVLVVPANWAHARYYAWRHLLIARAIENQCFVLGCNREGADLYGSYERGDSMILNYWGKDIGETLADGTIIARLDGERLTHDREKFSPWRDADTFLLSDL